MNFLQQVHKGQNHWWRWLLIIALFLLPYLKNFLKSIFDLPLFQLIIKSENALFVSELFVYLPLLLIFYLTFIIIHKRSFLSIITFRKCFDWNRFFFSFAVWGMLTMFILVFSVYFQYEDYVWNFQLRTFLEVLIIASILIPLQTIFTDALIKGYLLQGVAYFTKYSWVSVLLIISLCVFLTHLANEKLLDVIGFQIVLYYIVANTFLVLVTVVDNGQEISLGVKIVNNLIFSVFMTSEANSLRAESVLLNQADSAIFTLMYFSTYAGFPLYFIFLKKMYKWANWKEIFFNKVEE